MPPANLLKSKHFTRNPLANGVYACVHKPAGAAYSNAGIIDPGHRTLPVLEIQALPRFLPARQKKIRVHPRPMKLT